MAAIGCDPPGEGALAGRPSEWIGICQQQNLRFTLTILSPSPPCKQACLGRQRFACPFLQLLHSTTAFLSLLSPSQSLLQDFQDAFSSPLSCQASRLWYLASLLLSSPLPLLSSFLRSMTYTSCHTTISCPLNIEFG